MLLRLVLLVVVCCVVASKKQIKLPSGHARQSLWDAELEKLFLSVPSNNSAREHLRRITQTAHVAGTPEGLQVAAYVQDELAKALESAGSGVTVVMDAVKVLLAYPVSRSVSMRAGDVTYTAPLEEPVLPNDATSDSAWRNKTFNAYSPSGHVEAELVYANYGSPDDFDALLEMARLNSTPSGIICLSIDSILRFSF